MGFFAALGSSFGSTLLKTAGVLAIDAAAALLNGPKPTQAPGLKNKSFRSDAYGNPWPRARGLVRLQGKVLWSTNIRSSIWKTTSGGLFGLGQHSVYYNKYSMSLFIGFGKKLGGGAAVDILRIWADGKILFSKRTSTASLSGTVTVASGGVAQGAQSIPVHLASGATLTLNAGDLVVAAGDDQPYSVQTAVSASGVTTVNVAVWPQVRQDIAAGGAVSIPGVTSPYDLSSFDPNPHDGSHTAGGYPCPSGGINFYLGSATQQPDPYIVQVLGTGNVPGYRGIVGVCIHDLQLANYGDHPPQITAEIAFDTATAIYPATGPIPSVTLHSSFSNNVDQVLLPFSGTSSLFIQNPIQTLPYIWAVTAEGTAGRILYRVNTRTDTMEASYEDPRFSVYGPWAADAEGFIYYVSATGLNLWNIFRVDGLSMTTTVLPSGATSTGVGQDDNQNPPGNIYLFDSEQSLFGNSVRVKMVAVSGEFGGIWFMDRTALAPYGRDGVSAAYSAYGYKKDGTVLTSFGGRLPGGTGDVFTPNTPYSGAGAEVAANAMCVDTNGDFWMLQKDILSHYDLQFGSGITTDNEFSQIEEILIPPSFTRTDYNIGASVGSGGAAIFYNQNDNSIIVFGDAAVGKFDIATSSIILTAAPVSTSSNSPDIDILGTLIVGGGEPYFTRIDATTLQVTATYNMNSWTGAGSSGPAKATYDQASDSVWYNQGGGLYKFALDRGNGSGTGLDSIVSSLMLDAGFDSSQFDVTQLTSAGIAVGGWEFERETYADSLRKLMEHYLFDCAEIDGRLVFVPRGQASVMTIPEDDLGALSDPFQYEPRVLETLEDERAVPRKVTIKYYDTLKGDQQATQESKRISQAYASSLSLAKRNTNSKQELDITSPLTDSGAVVKKQADRILWEQWASRFSRQFKTGPKYIRLDPTDVITLSYKGLSLETRLEECDRGASGALEFHGKSQDQSAYTSTVVGNSGDGSAGGSGGTISDPPAATVTYTISPDQPLSEVSATDIHMVDVVASFSNGLRAFYNARDFTVSDPGAGNSQLYYVSILDPNFAGEQVGTVSLTAFCDTTPNAVHLGQTGYVFMGTITITHDGVGVVVTGGGSGSVGQAEGFYVNGTGGSGFTGTVDLVFDYMVMDSVRRPSFHLQGIAANSQMSKNYTYIDTATHSIAQMKTSSGWAADILLYYSDYIKQFITELDDIGHRDWSVNTSYKKLDPALAVMPRYISGNKKVVLSHASPNNYHRYVSCSIIDTLDKGDFESHTYGPIKMNLDAEGDGAGNLGDIQVIVNERYSGAKARERFYWGRDASGALGFVKWDAATLVSGVKITGVYSITNWSVHNKLVAGGGVTPSFGCSYGAGWP